MKENGQENANKLYEKGGSKLYDEIDLLKIIKQCSS
jgi:hypothetical protein